VNISQCGRGEVEAHYATGAALVAAGVVPGMDLTIDAAVVKLGWLLGSGKEPSEVRVLMKQDLCGELNMPAEEVRYESYMYVHV